jgi:CheY-like chemotaxis protein
MALVLVIDDDGFYRSVLRRILEREGHSVLEAEDGLEGLRLYRQYEPPLVITDMNMPGIDGAEVIRSLRDISRQVRIIAVSGISSFYNADLSEFSRRLGADAVFRKLDPAERIVAETKRFLESPTVDAEAV